MSFAFPCLPTKRHRRKKKEENIDIEDWQKTVLEFLFDFPGATRKSIESLRVPFAQLGFASDTDFLEGIPVRLIESFAPPGKIIVSAREFKKGDFVFWKTSESNLAELATFRKYNRSNECEAQIKFVKKSKTLKTGFKLNVRLSDLVHYKEFLRTFLSHRSPNIPTGSTSSSSRVAIVDSYQGSSPDQRKKMDNQNNNPHSNYEIGKRVYNSKKGKFAKIIAISICDSTSAVLVSYEIEIDHKNGRVPEGGRATLANFMADWDPVHPGQNNSSENPGTARQTQDVEDLMDFYEENPAVRSSQSSRSGEATNLEKHKSGEHKSKIVSRRGVEKYVPYERPTQSSVKKSKIGLSRKDEERVPKEVFETQTQKEEHSGPRTFPHHESREVTYRNNAVDNKVPSSSAPVDDVLVSSRKNRRNSTEISKSGERRRSTERRRTPEPQIGDFPASYKEIIVKVALEHDRDIKYPNHSISSAPAQKNIPSSSTQAPGPKLKPSQDNIPLRNASQKLAAVHKNLQNSPQGHIPDHRKYSTPPDLFPTHIFPPPPPTTILHENAAKRNGSTILISKSTFAEETHLQREESTKSKNFHNKPTIPPNKKTEKDTINSDTFHRPYERTSSSRKLDKKYFENTDTKAFIQDFEIERCCGYKKGIQGKNNSCYLDSTLFSLYYCTDIFDEITLAGEKNDGDMAREVKRILRDCIVRPLRQNHYCSSESVKDLRNAIAPLNNKIRGSFMDAEELMFLLFDDALKLKDFIRYSTGTEDFMHQIVPNPNDKDACQSVQVLFQNSLAYLGDMKFSSVPSPALILEMPRSDGRLVQYEAIIPNLTLDISKMMENGNKN